MKLTTNYNPLKKQKSVKKSRNQTYFDGGHISLGSLHTIKGYFTASPFSVTLLKKINKKLIIYCSKIYKSAGKSFNACFGFQRCTLQFNSIFFHSFYTPIHYFYIYLNIYILHSLFYQSFSRVILFSSLKKHFYELLFLNE